MIDFNEKMMRAALKEAKKAEGKEEIPIGCVIAENGKIVARAHNLRQTKRIATAHAEILAIEKACRKNHEKVGSEKARGRKEGQEQRGSFEKESGQSFQKESLTNTAGPAPARWKHHTGAGRRRKRGERS